MKAQSFSLALLLFTISCSNSDISVNELKFGGLKGNVSSYKEFIYDAEEKFGEVVPDDLEKVVIYEYDKDGHQIKFGMYDEDGDFIYKYEYTYEKGVLVSMAIMHRYGDNKRIESRIVERNKNYIKWCHEYGTANEYTSEAFYEKNFLCVKKENGEKMLETVYDKEGREIDQKRYVDGELYSRIKNEYNDAGLLVKSIQYWSSDEGDVLTYQYVEFDKKGNWVTSHVYEDGELEAIHKREIIYR